ncbi:16S rRNA (guanine(527)-N(7))-methyltransferase RsmG [Actibacterium sp. 188UL27-1]|uniref:16S rRNA (guanine(527)-N(7))-methyltransferase RsmG n=1 Tax=Actibacterium sp. 188UL27-1 TaxID=2786961 RepID=UPI0019576627|nr:16S rRNA (guanine(527)-N(7))-methyltransferase RsmG [Actibacterium sp. 188UL27-1]MBM7067272.1 16S rRNA (guanine(527)-N(7))-methyltransferase RsmG [Actibacterium sp. 188UL27-1]
MTSLDASLSILPFDVSRETLDKLNLYERLLYQWNAKINLVARSTLPDRFHRHFVDSAQLLSFVSDDWGDWLDLGSGGGFPGLVCAILAADQYPRLSFHLVESDQRKSVFLRTVARETETNVKILAHRVEDLSPRQASYLSARALSALPDLLHMAHAHLASSGVCLFMKGANYQEEVILARKTWNFDLQTHPSITHSRSAILELKGLHRVK